MNEHKHTAQAVIDVMRDLDGTKLLKINDEVTVLARPTGVTVESVKGYLKEYALHPERKTGTAVLTTLEALCEYVNRHKNAQSVIFVDDTNIKAPRIDAIFNAHGEAGKELSNDGAQASWIAAAEPGFQDFRAAYAFPLSEEWLAWAAISKEWVSQVKFAEFLEDRIGDVAPPGEPTRAYAADIGVTIASGARLLELSRGLAIHVKATASTKLNRGTGEAELIFTEVHENGKGEALTVPGCFAIEIPVFRQQQTYNLPVRMRYRLQDDKTVAWKIDVQRTDKAFENAINDASAHVEEETKLPVFRGKVG